MKQLLNQTRLTEAMTVPISSAVQRPVQQEQADLSAPAAKLATTSQPSNHLVWRSLVGQSLAQLLKRPEIRIEDLVPVLRAMAPEFFDHKVQPERSTESLPAAVRDELKSVETEIKYEGYLLQQQRAIDRLKKAEQRAIPEWFDYHSVSGLSREMREKLGKIRPRTLAQASRIPGVTPAAVSLVNVYIEIQARRKQQAAVL